MVGWSSSKPFMGSQHGPAGLTTTKYLLIYCYLFFYHFCHTVALQNPFDNLPPFHPSRCIHALCRGWSSCDLGNGIPSASLPRDGIGLSLAGLLRWEDVEQHTALVRSEPARSSWGTLGSWHGVCCPVSSPPLSWTCFRTGGKSSCSCGVCRCAQAVHAKAEVWAKYHGLQHAAAASTFTQLSREPGCCLFPHAWPLLRSLCMFP